MSGVGTPRVNLSALAEILQMAPPAPALHIYIICQKAHSDSSMTAASAAGGRAQAVLCEIYISFLDEGRRPSRPYVISACRAKPAGLSSRKKFCSAGKRSPNM